MRSKDLKNIDEFKSFVINCSDPKIAHEFMLDYISDVGNDTAIKNVMWVTGEVTEEQGRKIAATFGIRYSPLEAWL